jgi:hypothetical protein
MVRRNAGDLPMHRLNRAVAQSQDARREEPGWIKRFSCGQLNIIRELLLSIDNRT